MPYVTYMAKSQRRYASERGKNAEYRAKQAVKKNHGMHRRYRAVSKRVLKAQLKRKRNNLNLEGEQL